MLVGGKPAGSNASPVALAVAQAVAWNVSFHDLDAAPTTITFLDADDTEYTVSARFLDADDTVHVVPFTFLDADDTSYNL